MRFSTCRRCREIFSTGTVLSHRGLGPSIQQLKVDSHDKADAVKGHRTGKQWNFRKGIKKNQIHFNRGFHGSGAFKVEQNQMAAV